MIIIFSFFCFFFFKQKTAYEIMPSLVGSEMCIRDSALAAAVEHVRVDHGRADVLVTKQFLDGADVVARLEQVGREGVAQGVAARVLDDAGAPHRFLHGPLNDALVNVMAALLAL